MLLHWNIFAFSQKQIYSSCLHAWYLYDIILFYSIISTLPLYYLLKIPIALITILFILLISFCTVGVEADCVEGLYNLGLVNLKLNSEQEAHNAFDKLHTILPRWTIYLLNHRNHCDAYISLCFIELYWIELYCIVLHCILMYCILF